MIQLTLPFEWVSGRRVCDDGLVHLEVSKGDERIPFLIDLAQKNALKVELVNLRRPTLEDVFLHFTGKTIREEEGSSREKISAKVRSWRRK